MLIENISILTTKKRDVFMYIYVCCMCLYIYSTANVLWFERLPVSVCCMLAILVSSVKIIKMLHHMTYSQFLLCMCFAIYFFFSFFIWNWGENFFYLSTTALFLFVCSIILLTIEEKKMLLKVVSNVLRLLLLISIFGWILFLVGFDLPHSDIIYHPNGFHQYYDYYFFRLGAKSDDVYDMILPRFSGIFLEPGQLGTPCAFLFFLNGSRFNKKNIVYIIAIFLSFSLAAFGLFFWCIISRMIITSKHLFLYFSLGLILFCGTAYYFTQFESEDNPLNMFLFSRLEYDDEKIIAGNNRTSSFFDRKFDKFMDSSDCYLGIRSNLKEGNDWTYNCSGYKKALVHYGIIGFIAFMLFVFLLFIFHRSRESFLFFILIITAHFIRNLLNTPLWLSIAIIGFYIMQIRNVTEKTPLYETKNVI